MAKLIKLHASGKVLSVNPEFIQFVEEIGDDNRCTIYLKTHEIEVDESHEKIMALVEGVEKPQPLNESRRKNTRKKQ